jgi:hypothetical protein
MRTLNFTYDGLYALAIRMGVDPDNLLIDEANSYLSFLNRWTRLLYDALDWPEWTKIEQRTPVNHYIAWAEANKNVIGRALHVYLRDPQTVDGILDTPHKLNENGVFCGFEHGTNVWLKYITAAPQYTLTAWNSATGYAKDALAYDLATGHTYISIQAGNTNHPVSDTAWWAIVPFMEETADLVVRGAYADALREDGQTDKAAAEEQGVLAEIAVKSARQVGQPFNPMTDQSVPAPRYNQPRTA